MKKMQNDPNMSLLMPLNTQDMMNYYVDRLTRLVFDLSDEDDALKFTYLQLTEKLLEQYGVTMTMNGDALDNSVQVQVNSLMPMTAPIIACAISINHVTQQNVQDLQTSFAKHSEEILAEMVSGHDKRYKYSLRLLGATAPDGTPANMDIVIYVHLLAYGDSDWAGHFMVAHSETDEELLDKLKTAKVVADKYRKVLTDDYGLSLNPAGHRGIYVNHVLEYARLTTESILEQAKSDTSNVDVAMPSIAVQ